MSEGARRLSLAALGLAVLVLGATRSDAVLINEVLAWNHTSFVDEDRDYEDWIELYNPSAAPVYLGGYSLTDDPGRKGKWVFPAVVIPGNDFLLVWCSGKNRTVVGLPLHANFSLNTGGEFVGLYDPAGNVVDSLTFGPQREDVSYGRQPDGSPTWVYITAPTPLATNNWAPTVPGFAADPVFTPAAGPYSGAVTVEISTPTPGAEIRFTVDGTEPTPWSYLYTHPLYFSATTVVRAQVFSPWVLPSHVVTKTYLLNVGTGLPILSLVTNPANLWGPNGIYYANLSGVAGERPCSVEYWEEGGRPGFAVTCGLRMRGGASQSRGDIHKKSFRLDFRRERGPAKLEYRLFDSSPVDHYDAIALRANYNDGWTHWSGVQRDHAIFLRDELTREFRLEAGDIAAHGNFCMLYLDGWFWGIYNPCELIETDFLQSYTGYRDWDILSLSPDGACLLENGDRYAWDSFSNWFAATDFSIWSNYQALQTMLDLQNYTDYMIGNIILRNTDWPHRNGFVARARAPGAKWIALDWDAEAGLGGGKNSEDPTLNMMNVATDSSCRISLLLNRMLRSFDYRIYFAQRMDILLNTAYDEPRMIQRMNDLAATIRWAVPQEGTIQGVYPGSGPYTQASWEWALWRAMIFINSRTAYVRQHAQGRIPEITGWADVTVLPPAGGPGDVMVHTIRPSAYPWTGTFFRNIPVILTAVPQPDYVFVGWSDPALPNVSPVALYLTAAHGPNYTIYARFAPDPAPPRVTGLEFVARNRMVVTFSKPVERGSAETVTNYTADHGAGRPRTATLQSNSTTVLLEFPNSLLPGTNYQLSVINVKPVPGNPIPANSPARANAWFQIPPVTISEVMYNSIGPDVEWVELHNASDSHVNVSGWCLTEGTVYPAVSGGIWILPASTVIPPKGYIVVGLGGDLSGWNFPPEVKVVRSIVARAGSLNNSGDNLALFTAAAGGVLVDGSLSTSYPDLAVAGRSLEKVDDEFQWSGNPLAWRECKVPIGWKTALGTHATPGRPNGSARIYSGVRRWTMY